MVEAARERKAVVKLSAPFRIEEADDSWRAATRFSRDALSKAPIEQFIPGTDWPFIDSNSILKIDTYIA